MTWRLLVADLLPRTGANRTVTIDEPLAGLATLVAAVPEDAPVHAALHLERIPDGLVVRGTIEATFGAECGRCLQPMAGTVSAHVDELFEPRPIEGETYLLDHDQIDLAPLVRDAVVLELPHAPLCRPDCAGLCPRCGIDRNRETCDCPAEEPDDRWDALKDLRLDD